MNSPEQNLQVTSFVATSTHLREHINAMCSHDYPERCFDIESTNPVFDALESVRTADRVNDLVVWGTSRMREGGGL